MKTGQNCRPRAALYSVSVVRSQARLDSDVDPLVQFVPGEKTYDRFRTLSELLQARLGRSGFSRLRRIGINGRDVSRI
jgi:hypothetical protein